MSETSVLTPRYLNKDVSFKSFIDIYYFEGNYRQRFSFAVDYHRKYFRFSDLTNLYSFD